MKCTATSSTPQLGPAKKIARKKGIPYTSLRDVAFRGEIPVVKIGRAWYFDESDVDTWIAARKERLSL